MWFISYFIPYFFVFGALIRLQSRPAPPDARLVPGGRPVAIALGTIGIISTTATILLSAIPSADEPNKPLTVLKVIGGAALMVGSGAAVFALERSRVRRALQPK
jgi:hypothetical protein